MDRSIYFEIMFFLLSSLFHPYKFVKKIERILRIDPPLMIIVVRYTSIRPVVDIVVVGLYLSAVNEECEHTEQHEVHKKIKSK